MRLIDADAMIPKGTKVTDDVIAVEVALRKAPTVDALTIDQVAQILYDFTGSKHACNFNDNDEWLPMACDNLNECPDVKDELYCWKQFIKHYGERRDDDED